MRRRLGVLLLLMFGLPASELASVEAYPLSMEQRDRLKAYIPRTFLKLESQRPVHIVAMGDSVTWMYTRDDHSGNWLLSYLGSFSNRLAREFFYPGGVRALNPEQDQPAKLKNHLGREIYIENLAIPGRCALDGLQRVTTDAFINNPDLVVVDFGINDAVRGHSLDSYRKALQRIVDACRANQTDVILLAPSIVRVSTGPTGWGITRPYATVVREVADANQVLFVDLGAGLASMGGGVPAGVEPESAVLTMANRLGRIFEFDPPPETPETLHPNGEAHEVMGRLIFDALMTATPEKEPYKLGGRGFFENNETIKVRVSLRNQGEKAREGYLGALAMGKVLVPRNPYQSFSLEPGATQEFELLYERTKDEGAPGGRMPMDIGDPNLRLSYFVVDDVSSRLMDLVTRLEPVTMQWSRQTFRAITNGLQFEWRFINGDTAATRGKYRIGMGDAASDWVPFDLPSLGVKKFQATFPFKPPSPDAVRFKTPVFVEVDVAGKKFTFSRELEAVRDITLGQRVALSRYSEYAAAGKGPRTGAGSLKQGQSGVVMRVDADENFLFFTLDFQDVPFTSIPNSASLIADISIDARPVAEVGTFGFVDKVRVQTGAADGLIKVDRPQMAAFGDGYNMILPSQGIRAELKTRGTEAKRLELQIPRSYLFRYDGKTGSPDAILGLNAILSMAAVDGTSGAAVFPPERRYVLAAPLGAGGHGLYYRDPRGFVTLRLTSSPVPTWSAHLY